MNLSQRRCLALAASAFACLSIRGPAEEPPQNTLSLSRQFIVYCDDVRARMQVAAFVEETKKGVLSILQESRDGWQFPIVISIKAQDALAPNRPPSEVRLFEIETGFKIGISVTLGEDRGNSQFQQDVVHALLLEFAYRRNPAVKAGRAYAEPPPWLIEGIVHHLRNRDPGENADIFKTLVSAGRVPPIKEFLAQDPAHFDSTSRALYAAHAFSLLELLLEMPDGHASLATFVRGLPRADADPVAHLMKCFPSLDGSTQSLEKWWALSIARFASSDRFRGLTVAETEKELTALLTLDIPVNGANTQFQLNQFGEFAKNPASREVLKQKGSALLAFSPRAHALYRPVVTEYQRIIGLIARGKTKGIEKDIDEAAQYRRLVSTRMNDITDYMNWYETTQVVTQSGAFSGYFKAANEAAAPPPARTDEISRYLNVMEREFQ